MPAQEYIKHLVECKCVLPQFKTIDPPRWHAFVVFSEIDEQGAIIPSFVACNNCGIIHKVVEVGTSTIIAKDGLTSLPTIDDLKSGLPEKLVSILEKHGCDMHIYQEASFILEHKKWGRMIILTKEIADNMMLGKYLLILGDGLWKVNSFQEEMNENE